MDNNFSKKKKPVMLKELWARSFEPGLRSVNTMKVFWGFSFFSIKYLGLLFCFFSDATDGGSRLFFFSHLILIYSFVDEIFLFCL